MNENLVIKSIKFVLKEFIFDVLAFPLWWYGLGAQKTFGKAKHFMINAIEELGVDIWLKNLFVPMYGQTDWQGRLISFVMRFFQLIGRSLIALFWLILALLFFIFWLLLPLFVIGEIFFNLSLFNL